MSEAPIRLLSVAGTRPEAIKLAPVAIMAARRAGLSHRLLATGQHGRLFDDALQGFGLRADARLPSLVHAPSCPNIMADRIAAALVPILSREMPDMVIVQGDTTSALAGARAAARLDIPIAHVEAGLRSGDPASPWPEENNRIAIDALATLLLAPTAGAAANLGREAAVRGRIVVTGNSGVDAVLDMARRVPARRRQRPHRILLTCHRRESIGDGIAAICTATLRLADRGDVAILCPVHPNPAVAATVRARLSDHRAITLVDGLSYRDTVAAMRSARLILTDSGGIQEEAATLGVPTLVMRDVTERPEGVASGKLLVVGTDPDRILADAGRLLDDDIAHARMTIRRYPFGRGAAAKILDAVEQHFAGSPADRASLRFVDDRIKDGARQGV